MVIVAETEEKVQHNVNEYQNELSAINMEININKAKIMMIANEIKEHKTKIKGQLLEQVKSYRYLGTLIEYSGKVNEEISERTGKVENSLICSNLPSLEGKKSLKKLKRKYTKKL